jgi:hypothetical protein
LPDDNGDMQLASELAKGTSDSAASVQQAAEGLIGWASLSPTNFGTAGEWNVAFPVAGTVYTMTIPTDHAPLIRAILLLVVTAVFIGACLRLLLS